MMRARVAFGGAVHEATPVNRSRRRPGRRRGTPRGRTGAREEEVVWLPPIEAGTVIALGLNYADHARELAFNSQDEPLVFLKGPGTLLGHRGATRRPADVQFMHYECELAVIIGRPAKRVARAQAMQHVAGYCIANDYAVRDYLENWYRRICAPRIATAPPFWVRGWSMPAMWRIRQTSICAPSSTAS